MINLRYHIVSLTAVFLAMGIGLTLGSTFLDRATVENLNGQLQSLEQRLEDRDRQIRELQTQVDDDSELQEALDEQGPALLRGVMDQAPVVVLAARGVDEDAVEGALRSLSAAGADVQGTWWLTDRFLLADDSAVDDLRDVLGETSDDPARLRRSVLSALGQQLRRRQGEPRTDDTDAGTDGETDDGTGGETGDSDTGDSDTGDSGTGEEPDAGPAVPPAGPPPPDADDADDGAGTGVIQDLADAGFLAVDTAPGGADTPTFPAGTRLVVVGGSAALPDDVVLTPLVEQLALGARAPVPVVVTSAMEGDDDDVADVVVVIREDEQLRDLVATVDDLTHFQGWAATVLVLAEVGEGSVGHYGLGEGATRLLPPLRPS